MVERTHINSAANNRDLDGENALTGIRHAYTVDATQTEADRVMIRHFLNALAEAALAAAARWQRGSSRGDAG